MSTRPITVTTAQLRDILAGVRGATMLSFVALTTPEGRKAPFTIKKLVKVNAVTGAFYARAAAKHGIVANEERAWGERDQSALVTKGDSCYLPVQVNRASRPLYLVPSATGRLQVVEAAVVQPYLRPERPAPVGYRDYKLSSLISVALGGRRYRVRGESK